MDLSVYGRKPGPQRPGVAATDRDALDRTKASAGLTASALALLATLRQPLRLCVLAEYPHVLNRMAELWGDAHVLSRYFDDLLLDTRGGRQGFRPEVIAEIIRVQNYYQARVKPLQPQTDVWSTTHWR